MDKDIIIETTFNLIIENGLDWFSIGKLADELECTKSSIYNYFKSKNDLLNAVFEKYNEMLHADLDEYDDPIEAFTNYVYTCVEHARAFTFFHIYGNSHFMNEETKVQVNKNRQMLEKLVNDLYSTVNNSDDDFNSLIVNSLILGPLFGVIMRINGSHKCGKIIQSVKEDEIDMLIQAILRSIRKDGDERNNKKA